jgi:Holliday junction resolvase RusA-like endonuclease
MIEFFVPGKAQPGGSKKAFYIPSLGRPVVTEANAKAAGWKQDVKVFAKQAYDGPLITGAVRVQCIFHVERPKGHYGSGKNAGQVKASAPQYPTSKPDSTKLFRSTEDAITGVIWKDDAQVVEQVVSKIYSNTPGAEIKISPL